MSTVFPSDDSVLLDVVRSPKVSRVNLGLSVALIFVIASPLVWRQIKAADAPIPATPHVVTPPRAPTAEANPQTLKFRDLAPDTAEAINAAMPVSTLPNPAARPFVMKSASPQDRARSLDCLTQAVYYEAASEQVDGQRAVAQVIINRLRNAAFPKTVCGVVFQGAARAMAQGEVFRSGCQFSFACDGSRSRPPMASAWTRAQAIARDALNGTVMPAIGNATHYHTQWVAPYWSPSLTKIGQIGAHIFYRWAGVAGLPDAFKGRYAGGEVSPQDLLAKADPAAPASAPIAETTVAIEKPVAVIAKAAPAAPVALAAPPKAEIDDSLPSLQLTSYTAGRDPPHPRSALPSGW